MDDRENTTPGAGEGDGREESGPADNRGEGAAPEGGERGASDSGAAAAASTHQFQLSGVHT